MPAKIHLLPEIKILSFLYCIVGNEISLLCECYLYHKKLILQNFITVYDLVAIGSKNLIHKIKIM